MIDVNDAREEYARYLGEHSQEKKALIAASAARNGSA
jgi:hypothetical protein